MTRVFVDIGSHMTTGPRIVQVKKDATPGVGTVVNGKYVLHVLDEVPVTSEDYVLDEHGALDGGDLSSRSFAALLARYPDYSNIHFNPLLIASNYSLWGPSASVPGLYTGSTTGMMPGQTSLGSGSIRTTNIDVGSADSFMVYWKLHTFQVTHDVQDRQTGTNLPAYRLMYDLDPTTDDFSVELETSEGTVPVDFLTPIATTAPVTWVRLHFTGNSDYRIYIASYAVLF